jgi:hypothetical protein
MITFWLLIVFPQFVAKIKQVTRAVVRVIYEEKKPNVQIKDIEEGDKMLHKRINLSLFVAGLPSSVRDSFKTYLERWTTAG